MSLKIRSTTSPRRVGRIRKKARVKKNISAQKGRRLRLVIFRSNKFLYAQVVDDLKAVTLIQANTREKVFTSAGKKGLEAAKELGKLLGKRAVEKQIGGIVFDRNGYDFHGRVKAIADGAREAGLKF